MDYSDDIDEFSSSSDSGENENSRTRPFSGYYDAELQFYNVSNNLENTDNDMAGHIGYVIFYIFSPTYLKTHVLYCRCMCKH